MPIGSLAEVARSRAERAAAGPARNRSRPTSGNARTFGGEEERPRVEIRPVNDELPDTASSLSIMVRPIACQECGRSWHDERERWRIYVACFATPLVVPYCPQCAEHEFGAWSP